MPELWRPVVGFEGSHEVSNYGRVQTLDRWIEDTKGHRYLLNGQILKGWWSSQGRYLQVDLRYQGKRRTKLVHQLVMEAFVGPCPEGMEVLHGKLGHRDNRLTNLRYDTHTQNCAERVAAGTQVNGSTMRTAKLDVQKVKEIRDRHRKGESQTQLGKIYGVSQSVVSQVVHRQRWAHV